MIDYNKAYKRLSQNLTSDEQKAKLYKLLASHRELEELSKRIKILINTNNY